jgi:choline-sulfatase
LLRAIKFAAALAILLSCEWALAASVRRPQPSNVILITIDTVRADHVGCYGAVDVKTPTLDGLARDGLVFERAISQVPLTWPSHAAILTGTYPYQNGVQDFTGQPLDPRFRSVAQVFKQQGYATGAVVSAFVLDRSWGLGRGFDFYDDAFSAETFRQKDIGLVDRKAGESVSRAIAWLRPKSHRPFFFWLHLYDPHSPYDPPEPFRTQYKTHPYDGEIAYADHELGRLIVWLKQNQLYDRTAIVLLSDHGESLGDHGEKEHGFFVYDSTVHIPLIVKPPAGSGFRGGRVSRPVETVAIAPTLIRLAGMKEEVQKQFAVADLLGTGERSEDQAYSESFYSFSSFGWSPLHALRTSRYHYIEAPERELYDVVADPQEKNNLAAQQTATVAVLEDKLQSLLRQNPFKPQESGDAGLNPDALEKLRALGYVAYRSPVSAEALAAGLPDPKSKLWEFNAILEAGDAFHSGDFKTGESLLTQVQVKDPNMYIVPFLLGEAYLKREKWEEASSELRKSLVLNPHFDQAMSALARALVFLGQTDEAREWSRKALEFNPQNYRAWYQLGFIESKSNQLAAIADFEKAVSIQGNFAPLRRDLGLAYFRQGNYAQAADNLTQAIKLGVNEPTVYNFVGISYSRTNQLAKAEASYRRALELDPKLAEAHLNLAYVYQQMGQVKAARNHYQVACTLESKYCQIVPASPR